MKSNPCKLLMMIASMLILGAACNLPQTTVTLPAQATRETEVTAEATLSIEEAPAETNAPTPTWDLDLSSLKVVYTKEGDLYIWKGGQALRLTTSGQVFAPRISPDGQVIAFLRLADDFHSEIWAINSDGSDDRRLVSVADLDKIGGGVRDPSALAVNPFEYAWIPGSHTLAFNTIQVFQGPGQSLLDDLNLVDADSLEITYLFLSGWGGMFAYSPDGSQVALSNPSSIRLAQADGSNYRSLLEYLPVNTYSEYRFYASPLWSPEGVFLRVAIPPADPLALPAQATSLWKIPTDGAAAVQEGSVTAVPFFDTPVMYSPDLYRIAYLAETGQPAENQRELRLATFDGAGSWAYQKGFLLKFNGWSPDALQFTFNTGEEQETWLGSIEAPSEPLTKDPLGILQVSWANAENYLYVREKSGIYDFSLASLAGAEMLIDTLAAPPEYDLVLLDNP